MKQLLGRILIVLCVLQACRTPFDPEVPAERTSFLVVEGYLDSEGLASEIKLSRTVPLDSATAFRPETGALISLTSESGETLGLIEKEGGSYVFQSDISENQSYTLEIILRNGERFRSEPMRPVVTPEIIDAGFVKDEEGVEIFVTTQGNANADDFLWTYEETWIFRPPVRSVYLYDDSIEDVRFRTQEEQNALCFKSFSSPDILLETSSRYEEQVVFRQSITDIPLGDERIMERYSVLISQKAIEADAVKFWQILKKNTQDIGSIFSPLPSLIGGNIHSVDNSKTPVIGQVSLGVVRQRRIYIDLLDVFPWNYRNYEMADCAVSQDLILVKDYAIFKNGTIVPAVPMIPPGGTRPIGYYPTTKRCSDCRLYASPVIPDFWEDD
jgi:hypothetical protein